MQKSIRCVLTYVGKRTDAAMTTCDFQMPDIS